MTVFTEADGPMTPAARQKSRAAIRWNLRLWFEPRVRFLCPELAGRSKVRQDNLRGTAFLILGLFLTPIYVPVCVVFTIATQLARR